MLYPEMKTNINLFVVLIMKISKSQGENPAPRKKITITRDESEKSMKVQGADAQVEAQRKEREDPEVDNTVVRMIWYMSNVKLLKVDPTILLTSVISLKAQSLVPALLSFYVIIELGKAKKVDLPRAGLVEM